MEDEAGRSADSQSPSREDAPLLEMRGVRFGYEKGKPLLDGVDFTMAPGEFVVLEGPSGSGKSSLLRLLCRFEEPWVGEIRMEGKTLASFPPPLLRRRLHLLSQVPFLFEGTIRDNLLYSFRLRSGAGIPLPDEEALIRRLSALKLTPGLDDDASGLSPGEKQRVALIRALLLKPRVLLMDEPTSALDPDSRRIVEALSEEINLQEGIGILMVSHQGFQPERTKVRRLRMAEGKLDRIE
jgi:putative ABC transport system ATP-binding protein